MVETKTLDEIKREMISLKSNKLNERNKDLNWNMHSRKTRRCLLQNFVYNNWNLTTKNLHIK